MEEIKVNDYIRTPYNTIEKIIKVEENKDYIGVETDRSYYIFSWLKTHEVKHSSNIKDLIQAGDIIIYTINCKIADIDIVKEHTDARTLEKSLRVGLWSLEQVDIKQILTKERFERESYRVEE